MAFKSSMEQHNNKVILIGIGSICRSAHIPCLKNAGVKVVVGVDINKGSLNYFHQQFPRAICTSGLEHVPEDVSMAVVSSPVNCHHSHVKTLLGKGINVLCEKPLGRNYKESLSLVNLVQKKKTILQVGYYRRFHETTNWVREILSDNRFGILKKCEMFGGHNFKANIYPPSIFDEKLAGGGVLIDFGCHLLDRLFSWFGDINLVSYSDDNRGNIEANSVVNLVAKANKDIIPIKIYLSRTNNLGYYSLFHFAKNTIRIDHEIGNQVRIERNVLQTLALPEKKTVLDYFALQWKEFTAQVNGKDKLYSNLNDALRVSQIIDQCYANRRPLRFFWEENMKKFI